MKFRTDLAVECNEMMEKAGLRTGDEDGIIMETIKYDQDIKITIIDVINHKGEILIGKPCGKYITLEIKGVIDEKEGIVARASKALSSQLSKMIKFHYYLKVLIIGLGNEKITPDSLGPHTVSKVKITSHLFKIFNCDGDEEMSNVCGMAPGVTATTGFETAEVIEKLVKLTKPEIVIVIDALAAKNIERVSNTIQICDTGISPGAGMGNFRKEISETTLGVKVIAIGVPTVIDSKTLIFEAMEHAQVSEQDIKKYIDERNFDMVVTSTDIDMVIKEFSEIIAKGINITLHPGIYF